MATSTTALSAAGFVDSIGVNIHLPYEWTAYGNLNLVEQSLGYLGIDNVRDSLVPWSQIQPKYQALMDLGYHFDFILPIASIDIPGYVSLVDSYVKKDPGGVLAIEGPNEVNIWPVTYNGVSGPAGAVQFQTALYNAVRADPALNNIPVYNLTLGTADANAFKQLGNLSSVANYGNIHPYLHDDRAPVLTEQALFPLAQIDTPGKPAVITETGYTTATNNTYNGISEVGQAKYTLDTLMDAYKAGFSHTFLYELLDENSDPSNTDSESHYGLFNNNGTPKLAATAIHNLTTVLADPGASASFTPGSLNYTVSNFTAPFASQMLLEKSNGKFDLVLWAEPTIWDPNTRQDVASPHNLATVNFGQVESSVSVFDPLVGSTPIATYANVSQINVDITDHPLIIEITNGTQTTTTTTTTTTTPTTPTTPTPPTPSQTVIESFGSTDLTAVGNNFYLFNSAGSGPELQKYGVNVVAGQFGAWTPIGAEQTATGYEVAWKYGNADKYIFWNTTSSGNWVADSAVVSGSSSLVQSLEPSFHQDLNGDGVIGVPTSVTTTRPTIPTTLTTPTTTPAAPTIAGFSPDSNVVGDGTTNAQTLKLTGSAPANSTVTVFDGTNPLGTAVANGSGAWAFTANNLADGSHSFKATDTDASGHVSALSQTLSVTVDTSAPQAPVITGDTTLNTNAVSVTGTAEAGTKVNVFDGTVAVGTTMANASGAWSLTTNPLSAGSHAFTATATDAAGNTSLVSQIVDPIIGGTTIESFGSTDLTAAGNNFYLFNSAGSGPELQKGGVNVVAGQFGAWTPIGAEQTATGYEVAWKNGSANQYIVWNTNSDGNWVSETAIVPASSSTLQSLEPSFHQDLNGDGVIGVPTSVTTTPTTPTTPTIPTTPTPPTPSQTVIESFGSTDLTAIGNNFYLFNSAGSGPELQNGGVNVVAGQSGAWTPIGAEQTATGYEVALKNGAQYTFWITTSSGNCIASVVSGSSSLVQMLEPSFHQDLNGDGTIGVPGSPMSAKIVSGTSGNDTLTSTAANQVFYGNGGNNTFVFSGTIGKDSIGDFQTAHDVVQLSHNVFASFADVLAHAAQVGPDVTVAIDATNSITLQNTVLNHLTGSNFHLV